MLELGQLPLAILLVAFAAAAALVWWAGVRLPGFAAAIGRRTGIGQAFAGMLLLGGITTLPELSTATTAAAIGAGELAINNVLGSAAFNVLLLAIADGVRGRSALTSVIGSPATLLQAVLGMVLLALVSAAVVTGDSPLFGVGIWSALILLSAVAAMWIASRYETRPAWVVVNPPPIPPDEQEEESSLSLSALLLRIAGLAALILAGGVTLAQTGDAIAAQTGLDASLVGLVLVAFATSLPELSTITGAMRRGRYEMAVGDIFGANLFNVAMIFIIDAAYAGPPILSLAGSFEAVAALLALTMSGVFLIGLLERHDRTLFRFGYDSLANLGIYAAALACLAGGLAG